jgi:hypothetical protein
MPIIPVTIHDVEMFDHKLSKMCVDESAILIQNGGVFSNIFPKTLDRSRVFRKKYGVALTPGRLLFARLAEISLFFDYRDNRGEIQVNQHSLGDVIELFPEFKHLFIGIYAYSKENYRPCKNEK